jgi:hypothetical protein
MKKIIALIFLTATPAFSAQEILLPDASTSDVWNASPAGTKVDRVIDDDDGEFISSGSSDPVVHRFSVGNSTFDASATVDSVRVLWRGRDNGSGNNRAFVSIWTDASNYCDGTAEALTTSFAEYNAPFTAAPSGADACAGTLTKAIIDGLEIVVTADPLGNSREAQVSDIDLYVFYTEASSFQSARRRKVESQNDPQK